MRKKIVEEYITKAKKREIKKRPRMKVHGRSLKVSAHGGGRITATRSK